MAAIIAASATAIASSPPVIMEGGPDALGTAYSWTLTNQSSSPVVSVALPHYRASLFFAPKGWATSCTNLVAVGSLDAPGVCTATAPSASLGIAPGRSAQFGLQMGSAVVKRGTGQVVVELADSTRLSIDNVVVPMPERWSDKYVSLVGLGSILVIFIFVQSIRSRKKRKDVINAAPQSS